MRALVIPHVLLWIFIIFMIGCEPDPSNRGPIKEGSGKGEPSKTGSSKGGSAEEGPSQEEPGPSKKRKFKCTKCGECEEEECMCWGRTFTTLNLLHFVKY